MNYTRRSALALPFVLAAQDFDPAESMVRRSIGPEYQYHTNLRSTVAHPTRESLEYALTLLLNPNEQNISRAHQILRRVLPLQVKDPSSKWYGLWGWYLEEPPEKMNPADWNWADFNGSTLLMTLHFGAKHLPEDLTTAIRDAILHAARSIERRNVAMTYTNIAIKGTFVTSAAARLLNDSALAAYAEDRLNRLKAQIESTGTFAEFNSPTYAQVSMRNLIRMRLLVPDKRADWIERRLWLHLANHWHAPTHQLAGPMSRLYATRQPRHAWIETGIGKKHNPAALITEDDILPWHCPLDLRHYFESLDQPRTHRELFLPAPTPEEFVQGTTWLHPNYCLGTTNRSNFWNQSAAVIAYAKDASLRLRFFHDNYDFASALVFTVQSENRVLGLINFRSPGGDKHISLDPLPERFQVTKLEPRLELNGKLPHLFDFKMFDTPNFPAPRQITWAEFPNAFGYFQLEVFPKGKPEPVSLERQGDQVTLKWHNLAITGLAKVAPVAELDEAFAATIDDRTIPYTRLSE